MMEEILSCPFRKPQFLLHRTSFEDPSSCNSSCALPGTFMDRARMDIWVSSLDLESKDSELIYDRETDFDIFDSDFSRPSCTIMRHVRILSSSSSSLTSVGEEDKVKSRDDDSDEPIFWPFDNLYSCLDFENFLCPSPSERM